MSDKVKLVAESFQEWEDTNTLNEELNESAKGMLQKFIENPDNKKLFIGAFARQVNKVKNLKQTLEKYSTKSQLILAKQALEALKEPNKEYPWIKIKDGKITGAGALGVQKSELGSDLGA